MNLYYLIGGVAGIAATGVLIADKHKHFAIVMFCCSILCLLASLGLVW